MTLPPLPEPVSQALGLFVDAARAAFGENLRSLILFGSAAEGKLRATSDVNVLLVLRALERTQLDDVRQPLRTAQAAINLQAMFVLESELPAAADAFANKFEDIRRRHVVLAGGDVVNTLTISRDALLRRVRQVLLNLTLRLRDAYAEKSLREEQAAAVIADAAGPLRAAVIADAAGPLRAAAASILELEGRPASDPKSALATLAAGSEFATVLPYVSEARERKLLEPGVAATVLFDLTRLAQWMHQRASGLP